MRSGQPGNGHGEPPEDGRLVVVRVSDMLDAALTGHEGRTYESPAQSPQQALSLVRLLLGQPVLKLGGGTSWSCAVAGGRRAVEIQTQPAERGAAR